MGIASLSHLGVVAVVIAVMTILWKVRQRRTPGAVSKSGALAPPAPWTFFKAIVLLALFAGAMIPVFRTDGAAPIVHLVATVGLTVLAGLWLFRKR